MVPDLVYCLPSGLASIQRSAGRESPWRATNPDVGSRVARRYDELLFQQIELVALRDVRTADGLFAVVNGCPPDEGVMVELVLAIAWGKATFLLRDDFRRCADSEVYPLNLMLFAGLPESGWESYWYGSVEENAEPDKALARWLLDRTHPGVRRATGP